jgi:RND family efflux transporter MFP subunit
LLGAVGGAIAGSGCRQSNVYQPPPDPIVKVSPPLQRKVTDYFEETGTTEAVASVEIRARVRGFLKEVLFREGADVTADTDLYLIEPEQYQAAVDAAEAKLEAARVEFEKSEVEYKRQQSLFERNATAEQNLVAARAAQQTAKAVVNEVQAALDRAQLDLEYTKIKSPIDGRVGKTLVTAGNLVDGNEATLLTTVIAYDPIYARFNITEKLLLQLIDEKGNGPARDPEEVTRPIYLARAIDEDYPFEGKFNYADLAVDESTGTYMIRGEFPNADRRLLPGLFVRIRIPLGDPRDALLVPEEAVLSDQIGRFLYVVDGQNQVERRNVTLGPPDGPLVTVLSGLQVDDRVVIEGTQRAAARLGSTVDPQDTDLDEFLRQRSGAATISSDESAPPARAAPRVPGRLPSDADESPAEVNESET